MITEGEAAILLETTLHAFRNQEKTKQRSTIVDTYYVAISTYYPFKYVAPNAFLALGRGGKFDSNRPHFGEYVSTVVKLVSNKPSASPPRITLTSK